MYLLPFKNASLMFRICEKKEWYFHHLNVFHSCSLSSRKYRPLFSKFITLPKMEQKSSLWTKWRCFSLHSISAEKKNPLHLLGKRHPDLIRRVEGKFPLCGIICFRFIAHEWLKIFQKTWWNIAWFAFQVTSSHHQVDMRVEYFRRMTFLKWIFFFQVLFL